MTQSKSPGKIQKTSFLRRVANSYDKIHHFVSRVSDRYFQTGLFTNPDIKLEEMTENNPEVVKHLLDQALRDKALQRIQLDTDSPAFKADIMRRVRIKNVKQKISFVIGSVPMFKLLEKIQLAKSLNPQVQLPLNFDLYFGISLPAFLTLHIAYSGEHPSDWSSKTGCSRCQSIGRATILYYVGSTGPSNCSDFEITGPAKCAVEYAGYNWCAE